jgi:hypothetical protein
MKNKHHWLTLFVSLFIVWLFSRSLLRPDFFLIHDYTHPVRLAEMFRSLSAGQLPPTWSQNLGFGYGMPLFLFYGPLPYLVGCLFMLFGASPLQSTQWLFVLSSAVAFFGAFTLARRWGKAAAFTAGTLLVSAPYRAVDIFVRGALNEVVAIGILPWILHFSLKIREEDSWKPVVGLAIAVAALVLTHNLTALFSLPLIGIFLAIVYVGAGSTWKQWLRLLAGGLWGIALSLFYALPSFVEKNATSIDSILSGYFDYHLHFLYIRQLFFTRWGYGGSEYGPNDGISFHLGWTAIILAVLAVLFTIAKVLRHRQSFLEDFLSWTKLWKRHAPLRFWAVLGGSLVLALSLFLTLNHSAFIWESVPLLNFVQFPWRILGVSIVFLSLLGGITMSHVRPAPVRYFATFIVLIFLFAQARFYKPQEFLPANDGHFSTDPAEIRGNVSSVLPDYIPKDFNQGLQPLDPLERITFSSNDPIRWEMNDPHQLLAFSDRPLPTTVRWNIAHFPGWKYFVNGAQVQPEMTPDGTMSFVSGEAVQSVGAQFQMTPLRTFALAVSLIALLPLSAFVPMKKDYDQS